MQLKPDAIFTVKNSVFAVYVAVILILGCFQYEVNPLLAFDRAAIADGQLWRLVTASFVHLGVVHTLLNLAGFCFWFVLFSRHYPQWVFHTIIWLGVLSNGVLLYCYSPNLIGYAGLSGALHGFILLSLILDIPKDKFNVLIVIFFWCKLIYEQRPSYDVNYLAEHMNAPVIVDAHLYGGLVGTMVAIVVVIYFSYLRYQRET